MKNQRKRALRELGQVHHVEPTGAWTNTPITFDEDDQPNSRSTRVTAALVLNPMVDGFRLQKVLMDGGSGLNLIYEETLDKMQFDRTRIECSSTTFRG